MKAVLTLAVLVAAVAVSEAYRRPYYRDYPYDYDYRPMRPMPRRPYDDHEDSSEEEVEVEVDDHIYRFAISEDDHGPYMYHDETGKTRGFEIDLMHAICDHAHKECYALFDKPTNCWYNEEGHEFPGIGLMAGWYDGCLGMFPTVERKNSFDFSHAFTENMKVALYYKEESGLMEEDDHQLANHKIGFVKGWPTSMICLDHQSGYYGNHLGEYTAVMFDDFKSMVEAVMAGKVDAVMAPRVMGLEKKGLVHTEPFFECTTDGAGLMVSHGSEVLNWWDKAFDEMKTTGEYRELCRKAERVHGHKGELYCN